MKLEYPINRYAMEVKRQLDVLDRQLADRPFIAGSDYSLADMAIFPWYGAVVRNETYEAAEFLDAGIYKNVLRWADAIAKRPAVIRGRMVNRRWGPEDGQVPERHSPADFAGKATG
ncbi:hypothetical protein MASR1M32_24710 [Rhodobacter sp.]